MATEKSPAPQRRRFLSRRPSRAGERAARTAVIAVAALMVSTGLTVAFDREDSSTLFYDVMRLLRSVIIVVFWGTGLGALALSLRSLQRGDRSIFVWAALAVGVAATMLLIAELTVLE